jgi:hypothetical protein
MRNRKKPKTIDDLSVSQLLDDFLRVDILDTSSSAKDIDDEEYIRMMLKKDAQRELERKKREAQAVEKNEMLHKHSDTIDENIRQRFFPDIDENPVEEKSSGQKEMPEENGIVAEILDSLVVKDVSDLASKMKQAVDFVQEEMGTSESERRLIEALERYRETVVPDTISKLRMSNDNTLVMKRCQNCYFCAGERNRHGSAWCLCTNPDRTTVVDTDDSWVKSGVSLPCWKQRDA